MILGKIKNFRIKLGLTQSELAHRSETSLATIQNIEAKKANPSIEVLEKVLDSLGLQLITSPLKINFHKASYLGVPLSASSTDSSQFLSKNTELKRELLIWINQIDKLEGRTFEAFISFFMAIKDGYPTFYKNNIKSKIVTELIRANRRNGRVIKLRRIALSNLSEYL